jgi:hypothetical protein
LSMQIVFLIKEMYNIFASDEDGYTRGLF